MQSSTGCYVLLYDSSPQQLQEGQVGESLLGAATALLVGGLVALLPSAAKAGCRIGRGIGRDGVLKSAQSSGVSDVDC